MLDAPHSMMNKFSGPSDANFGLVSATIKNMVEEAKRITVSQREGIYWSSLAKTLEQMPGIRLRSPSISPSQRTFHGLS